MKRGLILPVLLGLLIASGVFGGVVISRQHSELGALRVSLAAEHEEMDGVRRQFADRARVLDDRLSQIAGADLEGIDMGSLQSATTDLSDRVEELVAENSKLDARLKDAEKRLKLICDPGAVSNHRSRLEGADAADDYEYSDYYWDLFGLMDAVCQPEPVASGSE